MRHKQISIPVAALVTALLLAPIAVSAADDPQVTPTLTTLYTFLNSPTDGSNVNAQLVMDASGNLYGTTIGGGPSSCHTTGIVPGCGIVFRLSPPASGSGPYTETILHAFLGTPDSANSQGSIIQGPGGLWYGTSLVGGNGNPGNGTIFTLTPTSGSGPWTDNIIIKFTTTHGAPYITENNVTYYGGNLYTTTQNGGQFGNYGTVLELVQNGSTWGYNVLHSFDGTDGTGIQAALAVDPASGNFYGVAQNGGAANEGTIFQLIPPAAGSTTWTFNKLYDFTAGTDGGYAYGSPVVGPKGVIYGMAQKFGEFGKGTLWTMTPKTGGGWTFAVIHQFGSTASDGATPVANVVVTPKGVIYGTTEMGGTHNKGTLFEFKPKVLGGYTETILWNFSGAADGSYPFAAPILVGTNELIGSSAQGGSANAGCIWKVTF